VFVLYSLSQSIYFGFLSRYLLSFLVLLIVVELFPYLPFVLVLFLVFGWPVDDYSSNDSLFDKVRTLLVNCCKVFMGGQCFLHRKLCKLHMLQKFVQMSYTSLDDHQTQLVY